MVNLRKFICIIGLLLSFAALSGCGSKADGRIETGTDISMIITTDIHYLDDSLNDGGEAFQSMLADGDGRQLNYVDEITDAFAFDVMKKKPDILIISGDLTQNGEKDSHMTMADKLEMIESKTGTRIFVVPGNHDIQNPWASGFKGDEQLRTETITREDFSAIYKNFGYGEAISKDASTLSYLAAPSEDVWLLMLDTNLYLYNGILPTTNGEIGEKTLNWIKQCSDQAKAANAQIVTVMHHNLLNHSEVLNDGFTLDNSHKVLEIFKANDLNIVLSGHVHIQDIKSTGNGPNATYDIATSSLSVYPTQYGEMNYSPSKGFDYRTVRVDVEGWAKAAEIMDENLIHFDEYSKKFFGDISFEKSFQELSGYGDLSTEDAGIMAEMMSLLNINYFGGTASSLRNHILQSEGHKLWNAAEPGFLKDYVLSMIQSNEVNNNQLKIPNQMDGPVTTADIVGPTKSLKIKQLEGMEENMKQIAEFLSINKNVQMATVGLDGKPAIRTIWFQFYENGRIYFQTDVNASLYKDIVNSPYIEFVSGNKDNTQTLRVKADVIIEDNPELVERVLTTYPIIKKHYDHIGNPQLKMFYLNHGKASIFEFTDERQDTILNFEW